MVCCETGNYVDVIERSKESKYTIYNQAIVGLNFHCNTIGKLVPAKVAGTTENNAMTSTFAATTTAIPWCFLILNGIFTLETD